MNFFTHIFLSQNEKKPLSVSNIKLHDPDTSLCYRDRVVKTGTYGAWKQTRLQKSVSLIYKHPRSSHPKIRQGANIEANIVNPVWEVIIRDRGSKIISNQFSYYEKKKIFYASLKITCFCLSAGGHKRTNFRRVCWTISDDIHNENCHLQSISDHLCIHSGIHCLLSISFHIHNEINKGLSLNLRCRDEAVEFWG